MKYMKFIKGIMPVKIKDLLCLLRTYFLRQFTQPVSKGLVQKNQITILSDGENPTFFGYHDKTPFSADGSKILAMSITASDTKPESECTPMNLGYFKKQGDTFVSEFTAFAQTTTWCWQQGCMLQWHPLHSNRWVVFNDLVDGAYGSKVYDVERAEEVRAYSHPIYSLDPKGRWASTLNFSRLGRLRPGYGYGLLPDNTINDRVPEDDGLFIFDLETGEKTLVVSLHELAESGGVSAAQHYVNHATFSPDGKRIVFFHLWAFEGNQGRGLRVCETDVVTGEWREIESERIVSHYCWRDGDVFLATSLESNSKWNYTLYDLKNNTRQDMGLAFNEDGHPMFHPTDKNVIVTDTYPDKRRDQHLCVVSLEERAITEVSTLHSPIRYRRQVRCDLHPRWDREGWFVVVDSTRDGTRKMQIIKSASIQP
jgi:hypothetical protein